MNKSVNPEIDSILKKGTVPLDVDTFRAIADHEGALVLDTRHQSAFLKEHIPGSIFIGIDGGFAPWVGALITDINQPIILVTPKGREEEVVTRLSRIGYDNSLGYLDGGIEAWKNAGLSTASIKSVTPESIIEDYKSGSISIVDARKPSENYSEHIVEAISLPLDSINADFEKLDKDQTYYVHCAGGYRSVIFISILKARGYHNLIDVAGGYKAIKESEGFHLTDYVCPTTMS